MFYHEFCGHFILVIFTLCNNLTSLKTYMANGVLLE